MARRQDPRRATGIKAAARRDKAVKLSEPELPAAAAALLKSSILGLYHAGLITQEAADLLIALKLERA